jgi:hypothetical protein
MRLTLRTLLAYRDGVLSPADHEDLHRRIQQSPDAGKLLRRIQELTSSNNLLTPKLESTGLAGANVIAEYLDDALTSIRIAELERLFLEYSEHLCELAHCHQMLAEAMHTQIEVPNELYRKALEMIQPNQRAEIKSQLLTQSRKLAKQLMVAEVVESNSTVPNSAQTSPVHPSAASPNQDSHTKLRGAATASASGSAQQAGLNLEGTSLSNEVPEYLLGARKRRWQIPAAILALTAVLILLVWQSIGSLDNLRSLMLAKAETTKNSSEEDSSKSAEVVNNSLKENGPKKIEPTPTQTNSSTATEKVASDSQVVDGNKNDPARQENAQPNPATKPNEASSKAESSATTTTDTAAKVDPANPDSNNLTPPTPAVEPSQPSLQWIWKPTEAFESQSVALVGSGDTLSLIDTVAQPITAGKLIVPPVARTTFEVGPWKWQSVGPSVLNVDSKEANITVKTSLCRALLSAKSSGQTISLETPAGNFEIQLIDKAAWLGIEVNYRAVAKGSVVEPNTYAPTVVIVVGTEGATTESELMRMKSKSDEQVVKIDSAGRGIAVLKAGQMEIFALQSPPAWYRKRSIRAIDQLGMADFHTALSAGTEPMKQRLRLLATDSRPEVASLAIQTSLLLGDWQPWAAELLAEDRMRSHWNFSIELARQILAAQPNAISNLQAELQAEFGADSDRILNLTVGLPQANQNNDGLAVLVKGLDPNAMLPVRVLTAYELKHLTGEDFSYQPHAPVRASLQQWRSRLAGGKVQLLPVNDPIAERYSK